MVSTSGIVKKLFGWLRFNALPEACELVTFALPSVLLQLKLIVELVIFPSITIPALVPLQIPEDGTVIAVATGLG